MAAMGWEAIYGFAPHHAIHQKINGVKARPESERTGEADVEDVDNVGVEIDCRTSVELGDGELS